ncbi:hypothetical protein ACFRJ8_08735 [Arthrobacter sp. NPDC056886]|uniref:hypothetical protein n=1 Tax=Arthrobacter sp. NPDC056886 TaxID=3345960 RepID=UPI00366F2681
MPVGVYANLTMWWTLQRGRDDKTDGYVIDYRDLFKSLDKAITDYTSEALDGYAKEDVEGLLEDRIKQEREDLYEALEKVRALCEPVAPPIAVDARNHSLSRSFLNNLQQTACSLSAADTRRVAGRSGHP